MLWPEQSQANARASLRHALWSLKAAGLEATIDKRPGEIGLQFNYWLDVNEFRMRIAEHRQHAAGGYFTLPSLEAILYKMILAVYFMTTPI
jgi:DNA-binding SARP family transcriptional activator